uniref:BPTI/Kunitz inhibitor domain-containing protein n=1 Tax=Plectus sambesii TaxID=2011161 RepID=A0A914X288_9BILA
MPFRFLAGFLLITAIAAQENLSNARCNHYPDRGSCEENFQIKWYYDRYGHRCREFFYGGCDGNDNRFDSKEECSRSCQPLPDQNEASLRCSQLFDAGDGSGDFERWYFDAQQGRCVCISWSGSGGNSNLYYSYPHCMSICGAFAKENAHQQASPRHRAEEGQAAPYRQTQADRSGQRLLFQPYHQQNHLSEHSPVQFNYHGSRSIRHLRKQTKSSDAFRSVKFV